MPSASPLPSDALRLFVALWPDTSAHAWLREADAAVIWLRGAARAGPERWHITLHFLGAVPRAALPGLLPALQQPFDPFEFELGRLVAWPRGLAVVEPLHAVPALQTLHAALGQALHRAGQRVETRPFKPHVTLARRAPGPLGQAPSHPQCWSVSSYALVASAGGRYRNIALYPGGVLSRAADPAPATAQSPPAPRPKPR